MTNRRILVAVAVLMVAVVISIAVSAIALPITLLEVWRSEDLSLTYKMVSASCVCIILVVMACILYMVRNLYNGIRHYIDRRDCCTFGSCQGLGVRYILVVLLSVLVMLSPESMPQSQIAWENKMDAQELQMLDMRRSVLSEIRAKSDKIIELKSLAEATTNL